MKNIKFPTQKWFVILVIALVIIIIAAVVLVLIIKKAGPLVNQNQNVSQEPEKLVRYGKMILQSQNKSPRVGETFKVDIVMDTQNSNIVVASALVEYDAKVLELSNVDAQNSALSMSIIKNQEPGMIEIIRGAPGDTNYQDADDGYSGSDGVLASLEFKALSKSKVEVKFDEEDSNMILDNGQGTAMVVEFEDVVVVIQ